MDNTRYEQAAVLGRYADIAETEKLLVSLGTDINGETFSQDVGGIPHFLVCGFSGSGKTSFIQSLMHQICTSHPPDEIRFIVYDSKAIDYGAFESIPHMLIPVITEEAKVCGALHWLNTEVQRRIRTFSNEGVKDLAGHNRKNTETLPRIFAILDDFSSISLDTQSTAALTNVLKNGRVAGIHCVLVTSMPSSRTLQKDIISNLPCRISFCVSIRADSRVAIEQNGAENLQVPGELIFKYQNQLVKCHAVYIPYSDIQESMNSLRKQQKKNLNLLGDMAANIFSNDSVIQSQDDTGKQLDPTPNELGGDEMLPAAVDVILETGQASVSMIQRRLKLGYARAAKIVDEMEEKGVVGPFQGSKPRAILITKEQWESMCAKRNNTEATEKSETPNQLHETNHTVVEVSTPGIILRDFAQFNIQDGFISIYDNQVHVGKKVMTPYGSGTTTAHFTGDSFSALIYKKPRLFSSGYLEFRIKSKASFMNESPELIDVNRQNCSQFLRLQFGGASTRVVELFLQQLSEDSRIGITEV